MDAKWLSEDERGAERFRTASVLIEPEISELFEYIDYLKADAKMVMEQGIQQVRRAENSEERLAAERERNRELLAENAELIQTLKACGCYKAKNGGKP